MDAQLAKVMGCSDCGSRQWTGGGHKLRPCCVMDHGADAGGIVKVLRRHEQGSSTPEADATAEKQAVRGGEPEAVRVRTLSLPEACAGDKLVCFEACKAHCCGDDCKHSVH